MAKVKMPALSPVPAFSVYSLADVRTSLNHPDCGTCILSNVGGGRVTINYAGDMASNTNTASGFVVVNKLVAKNGSIALEIPVNSLADKWLRTWITYLKSCGTDRFALSNFTLIDSAASRKLYMTGVVPQKEPDESYDQTSGNRQYNLLFAELTVSGASKA